SWAAPGAAASPSTPSWGASPPGPTPSGPTARWRPAPSTSCDGRGGGGGGPPPPGGGGAPGLRVLPRGRGGGPGGSRGRAGPGEVAGRMAEARDEPIFLTAAGRRRLEQRLADIRGEEADLTSPDEGQEEGGDTADAALQLTEADDRDLVRGLEAHTRDVLARARPVPEGPDDGVVRLGSTVGLRDAAGAGARVRGVGGAEVEGGAAQGSADS